MAKKVTKTENTERKEEQTNLQSVNTMDIMDLNETREERISYTSHDIFELNQKIIAITTLISYYINFAKANEGYYEHNHNELYLEAQLKISQLEFKKNETIKQLEKIILGNVKENMD